MDTHSKNISRSRAIHEILPADVAYYQTPIEISVEEAVEKLKDQQVPWDSDISAFMWDTLGITDPQVLDGRLRRIWHLIIDIAKNTHCDDPKQDSLVRYILSFREMGILTSSKEAYAVAKASNGQRLWVDLPYLAEDIRKAWVLHSGMTVEQRTNFASFIARLASVGVCDNTLAGCALLLFRDAFEVPRQLENSHSEHQDDKDLLVEELLPAVRSWTDYASFKLVSLTLKSINEYDAEDADLGQLIDNKSITPGFSLSRWDFWTKRLVQLIESGYEPVTREAGEIMRQMATDGYFPL